MEFVYIAEIIIIIAIIASIAQHWGRHGERPQWLYRLQYLALFCGCYLIIQYTNAAIFLTVATLTSCLVFAYDQVRKRHFPYPHEHETAIITEVSRDLWLFLIIFTLFRTFIYDYSPVPSGSMEPTLVAGDLLAINKMAYQAKLPPIKNPLYKFNSPQRGDVIIFNSPIDPMQFYVKRVIAVGGDHIMYQDKKYYVNGKALPQTDFKTEFMDSKSALSQSWLTTATETNGTHTYNIQLDDRRFDNTIELDIPEGMYFVSGDNRDYSADSRIFGPIKEESIVGKAAYIITQFTLPTIMSFQRSGEIS